MAIEAVQRPAAVNVAFLACPSYQHVLAAMAHARNKLGEILSAFEFLDAAGMICVRSNAGVRSPLQEEAPFYILIETHGSIAEHDQEKLQVGKVGLWLARPVLCHVGLIQECVERRKKKDYLVNTYARCCFVQQDATSTYRGALSVCAVYACAAFASPF